MGECNGGGEAGMEPIAIIGMGCRFPGEVTSPSKLWELLEAQRSAQSVAPKNRFNVAAWYHPDSQRPGALTADGGYFLGHDDSFRDFDPSFFGINPKEATTMDPQQRKLLEVVYECFESSGATLEQLSGSQTGCYVGCFTSDSKEISFADPEYSAPYQVTGGGLTILSNRVNYVFNLKGPSLSVDTACSSSLYALDIACQSLLSGGCTAAIVGGTSIILDIKQHMSTVALGVLSPTSTCHTFDESADGFGRAEGIVAIYIKRLSDALTNGDPIRAVIRATATNANGKSAGLNAPSAQGQAAVIRKAYEKAGLDFDLTGYFECHGTGTPVGDPIECAAIGSVFASGRTPEMPLLIGAIKTNIGHTEGASGLASIMKVVLSFEKGIIPATVGVKKLNPNIDFRGGRLQVVRSNMQWPEHIKYHRASVNSFGYGGANGHVVIDSTKSYFGESCKSFQARYSPNLVSINGHSDLEELAVLASSKKFDPVWSEKKHLFVFSAHDHPTLVRNIQAVSHVADMHEAADLAYTLSAKRSRLHHRGFGISTKSLLHENLEESRMTFGIQSNTKPILAFAFTGQGAQWAQMGYSLIQHFPSVRGTMEQLQVGLDRLPSPPEWKIIDSLAESAKSSRIMEATLSPPLCTALQIAVVTLLRSWGISPTAVIGHSSGEVAAAYTAGLLTASEAMAIAYYRGVSCALHQKPGAMMAVGLGAEKVKPFVVNQPDVVIACHNSPVSVTLSGGEQAIDEIRETLLKAGVFARKLNTSGNAYHSHLVKAAGQHYQECFASSIDTSSTANKLPKAPMYSCIAGELLEQYRVGIGYWRQNLESPVKFDVAMRSLVEHHPQMTHLIEIGPHSALAGPIKQIRASLGIDAQKLTYLPSLIRGEDGVENLLKLAGVLFTIDFPVSVEQVNTVETIEPCSKDEITSKNRSHIVDLPTYQWNYEGVLWSESRLSHELRFRNHGRHDLLGSREPGSSINAPLWRNRIMLKHVPWLRDHQIGDDIIFPAAGYIAMAIEAVTQVAENRETNVQGYTVQRLNITAPLVLQEEGDVELLFNLRILHQSTSKEAIMWFDFQVTSVTIDSKWTEHAAGMIAIEVADTDRKAKSIELRGHHGAHSMETSDRRWYSSMSGIGLNYGPTFQPLSDIRSIPESNEATAKIALQTTKNLMLAESHYVMHPSTIDGCLQLSFIASKKGNVKNIDKAYLPVTIEHMKIWKREIAAPSPEVAYIRGHGTHHGLRSVHASAEVSDIDGRRLLEARIVFFSVGGGFSSGEVDKPRQPYLRVVWKPDIEMLGNREIRQLFPGSSVETIKQELLTQLDELCALRILESCSGLREVSHQGDSTSPTQDFEKWLQMECGSLKGSQFDNLSPLERKTRIEQLASGLRTEVPEAQLIAKLFDKTPEIFSYKANSRDLLLRHDLLDQIHEKGLIYKGAYKQLTNIAKLMAHKEPRLRVLELGAGIGRVTKAMLTALCGMSLQPQYSSYTITDASSETLPALQERLNDAKKIDIRVLDIGQDPLLQGFEEDSFDLIVASDAFRNSTDVVISLRYCKTLLKPGGELIIVEPREDRLFVRFMKKHLLRQHGRLQNDEQISVPLLFEKGWETVLHGAGFSGNDVILDDYAAPFTLTNVFVSTANEVDKRKDEENHVTPAGWPATLWLVYLDKSHALVKSIQDAAAKADVKTESIPLLIAAEHLKKGDRIILVEEVERALLSHITKDELAALQFLTRTASSIIWLTNGGLLAGKNPEMALITGFAGAVMTEHPSLRLCTIDLDPDDTDYARSASLILQHEVSLREDSKNKADNKLIIHDGVPYVSRYMPDDIENERFERQIRPMPVKTRLRPGLSLDFLQVGDVSSFYFKEVPVVEQVLRERQVLLRPICYGLSKTEGMILRGQNESEFFSSTCVAVVSKVGPYVTKVKDGDRVVCLATGNFDSTLIADENLCETLNVDEDTHEMAGLLVPYCTALYGLINLGRIRKGDTVLIHVPAEPVAIAALSIARMFDCKILVTMNMENGAEYSRNNHAILEICILDANAPTLAAEIKAATDGRGVDIVFTGLGAGGLTTVWDCLAKNGKFVLVGGSTVPDMTLLDPAVFMRGASFCSFDFFDLITSSPVEAAELMQLVLRHYRAGRITALPKFKSFDIVKLPLAVQMVTRGTDFSSIVLDYGHDSVIPVQNAYEPLIFDSKVTYLLVGCLGGLGRSLASWMVDRGARHLIFLSRSGADKPEAAALVRELRQFSEDVSIQVVRGDVSVREDVDRAISESRFPVRGVIQAAMHLDDHLFGEMSLESFNAVLQPKVQGTINLHEALLTEPLDFFVMTSSIASTIGTVSQTSYSAANAFLDNMARHRRHLGLRATSIALGMILEVGHVEAHPEVAEALKKTGIYGIDEDEYLRMMELACRPPDPTSPAWDWDDGASAHLVTGLERGRLSKGIGKTLWFEDNRLRGLMIDLPDSESGSQLPSAATASTSLVLRAAAAAHGEQGIRDAVRDLVLQKFAQVVLVPKEKLMLSMQRPLAEFGMDSMISTELRTWSWRELRADVPFMRLLDSGRLVAELVDMVWEGMDPALKAF